MSSSHPYTVVDEEDDTDICPVCDGQCTCPTQRPPQTPTPSLKIKFTLPPSLIAKHPPLKKRGRPPKKFIQNPPTPPVKSFAKINKVRHNLKAKATISKKVVKRRRVAVQSDQDESYSSDTLQPTRRIYNDKLPTFVSASALSSISSSSDSSSSSHSLSDFDSDPDSDLQAEEENFIVADIHDKARLRRELLGGDDPHLKKRSPNWVIRPRKKSVGGSDAEQMDVDSDHDHQNDDEDDEDADQDDDDEDQDEPDGLNGVVEDDDDTDTRHRYVGLATGWSEDEDESSFDADLFFANLSDSSSTSTSSTRRRFHSYTPGGIDADQSSSTSESPTRTTLESLPFEVTENWDGQLIFTNGETESRGIVDIDFEKDTERYIVDTDDDDDTCSFSSDHLNYNPPSTAHVPESSDIDMFSISDADAGYEEEDGAADEGDTTDEELVGDDCLPNERAMRLFTLPMPMPMGMSAINPMSTVSPNIGIEKRRHTRRGMDVDGDREERKRWKRRLRLGTNPRAADILAGKVVFWGDGGGYASSSSASSNSIVKSKGKGKGKAKAFFSPSSSPPSASSHADHPRQRQIPSTPRTGIFIPTGQTRQAVIGDGKKGTEVPSPHPRFNGRRSRISVVQYLLKKHLQQQQSQSQSPVVPPPPITASSPSTPSPFHHLLSPAAASPLTATEDPATTTNTNTDEYDTGRTTPCPAETEVDTPCIVELDDVLEASFLDDSMDRDSSALPPTSGTNAKDSSAAPTTSATTTTSSADPTTASAVEETSNKHLTRWDVISIGAFRQTREQQQQQTWGPGSRSSSATGGDYGGVIKSGAHAGSPLSALLWQNSGAGSSARGAGSSKKTSASTPKNSTSRSGSSTKAAKRRRLMMSSSMSSPLVLPLSSTSLITTPMSRSHSSSSLPSHSQSQSLPKPTSPTTHKNRKELRREKRLLKKKSTHPSSSSSQQQASQSSPQPSSFFSYGAHPNNNAIYHHQFHTHQHHPNAKTRGTSSSQRMGFFGGAVPPLNL